MRPGSGTASLIHSILRGVLSLATLLTLTLSLAPPAFARGTAEEAWQPVSGDEIWRHEIDLTDLPPGTHNIIVRARDFAGNETIEGPYNLRIDPSVGLPTVRVVYPERNAVLRDDIGVIGVATGRAGVARVHLRLNDGPPMPADGSEYWGRTISAAGLPDGQHLLAVRAIDERGTEGPEVTVPFVLDRSPPSVNITSHRPGALVSGNITIQGTADDANGVVSVELSVDGGRTYEPLRLRTSRGSTEVGFSFGVQTRRMPDGATIQHLRVTDGTGTVAVHPVLFFVDNEPPSLEILAPQADDAVFGRVRLTGTVSDEVGIDRLFYEWNRSEHDIPLRPGDPYWTADLDISGERGRTVSLRLTAVDLSGNRTTITHRLQNTPDAGLLTVELSYPDPEQLSALSSESYLYGRVVGGLHADAVVAEGVLTAEYPARPGFRIAAADIPVGRGELRLRARAEDGTLGPPLRVRVVRLPDPEEFVSPAAAAVTVSAPRPFQYISESVVLEGRVSGVVDRVEYRLSPAEPWRTAPSPPEDAEPGAVAIPVRIATLPEGPVHLELRTVRQGRASAPLYLPINHSPGAPMISVTSPRPTDVINGLVTVSGAVCSRVPIDELAYTLDGETFTSLEVTPTCVGNAFVFPVDFTALEEAEGQLQIRVRDVAGNEHTETPVVRVDRTRDLPVVQLNLPQDGDVITSAFAVSGFAFDDDGVAAVYWRIGDGEFRRVAATQSFRFDVTLEEVESGEQTIEVYAEDIYGLAGEPVSVTVQVSKDSPVIEVLSPERDDYNRGEIVVRGTANDANGIALVRVSMDNGNSYQRADGTDEWSIPLNTAVYRDGSFSMLVVATDALGVESRTTALVSIDNTPPVVSLAHPADGKISGRSVLVSGRVDDNVEVASVMVELIGESGMAFGATASALAAEAASNAAESATGDEPAAALRWEPEAGAVILEEIDVSQLPPGSYRFRLTALDRAGNRSVETRTVEISAKADSYRATILHPLPGATHTGPLTVAGRVFGPELPERVRLMNGEVLLANAEVDVRGFFRHELADSVLRESALQLSARFDAPTGESVASALHHVSIERYGPTVTIDSHESGDVVTGRPWLRGRAWIEVEPGSAQQDAGRRERQLLEPTEVLVSLDNGRTFASARGTEEWQFRLETVELARGTLPVVVQARFADGRSATTQASLTVDTAAPSLSLIAPLEGSRHTESLAVFGTAADEYGLAGIEVALRPGDKSGYSVPQFIQGLYLDAHVFGATYADLGLGVSFFDDNVKLQVQAGVAPPGRFTGTVLGAKLLANVLVVPFDYFLGPDWSFFSMALALGANFSYFTMDEDTSGLVMSAVLAQWEFARFEFAERTAFRNVSLYLEPNFWFASSDVEAGTVFRMSLGLRTGLL